MTPDVLPSVDTTVSWHGIYEYKYNSNLSSNTESVYSLWDINNAVFISSSGVYSIKVIHASNTWHDYGSDIPDDPLTINGNNIELYNASRLQYVFVKPTTADWISSGGGGGGGSSSSTTSKKVFCNFW